MVMTTKYFLKLANRNSVIFFLYKNKQIGGTRIITSVVGIINPPKANWYNRVGIFRIFKQIRKIMNTNPIRGYLRIKKVAKNTNINPKIIPEASTGSPKKLNVAKLENMASLPWGRRGIIIEDVMPAKISSNNISLTTIIEIKSANFELTLAFLRFDCGLITDAPTCTGVDVGKGIVGIWEGGVCCVEVLLNVSLLFCSSTI